MWRWGGGGDLQRVASQRRAAPASTVSTHRYTWANSGTGQEKHQPPSSPHLLPHPGALNLGRRRRHRRRRLLTSACLHVDPQTATTPARPLFFHRSPILKRCLLRMYVRSYFFYRTSLPINASVKKNKNKSKQRRTIRRHEQNNKQTKKKKKKKFTFWLGREKMAVHCAVCPGTLQKENHHDGATQWQF